MVNSGAIMSASILLYLLRPEMNMAQKYDYVHDFFKVFRESKNRNEKPRVSPKETSPKFPPHICRPEGGGGSQKPAARD